MEPKHVVIHCSDSPFGDANLIDNWHLARGWLGIGYHYVILNGRRTGSRHYRLSDDGLIETGRPERVEGAHARGMNGESIGIVLIGVRDFTSAQFVALYTLASSVLMRYRILTDQLIGHYETPNQQAKAEEDRKTCPNLEMRDLRAAVARIRGTIANELQSVQP